MPSFHISHQCKPEDLCIGSEWQEGPSYLRLPFDQWPWERNFAAKKMSDLVPKEELKSKFRGAANAVKSDKNSEKENEILELLDNGFVTNSYDVLISKTEPYFRWFARVKSKKNAELITMTSRDYAVRFWFRLAMPATVEAMKSGRLRELTLTEMDGMIVI